MLRPAPRRPSPEAPDAAGGRGLAGVPGHGGRGRRSRPPSACDLAADLRAREQVDHRSPAAPGSASPRLRSGRAAGRPRRSRTQRSSAGLCSTWSISCSRWSRSPFGLEEARRDALDDLVLGERAPERLRERPCEQHVERTLRLGGEDATARPRDVPHRVAAQVDRVARTTCLDARTAAATQPHPERTMRCRRCDAMVMAMASTEPWPDSAPNDTDPGRSSERTDPARNLGVMDIDYWIDDVVLFEASLPTRAALPPSTGRAPGLDALP